MAAKDGAIIELYNADGHLRKLSDIESDVITLAVNLYGGSIAEVSRRLCIGRSTLYRKLDRHEDLNRRFEGESDLSLRDKSRTALRHPL